MIETTETAPPRGVTALRLAPDEAALVRDALDRAVKQDWNNAHQHADRAARFRDQGRAEAARRTGERALEAARRAEARCRIRDRIAS